MEEGNTQEEQFNSALGSVVLSLAVIINPSDEIASHESSFSPNKLRQEKRMTVFSEVADECDRSAAFRTEYFCPSGFILTLRLILSVEIKKTLLPCRAATTQHTSSSSHLLSSFSHTADAADKRRPRSPVSSLQSLPSTPVSSGILMLPSSSRE